MSRWLAAAGILVALACRCATAPSGPGPDAGGVADAQIPDSGGDRDSGPSGSDAAIGADGGPDAGSGQCVDYNRSKNVYWGDLHSHTEYSIDAYAYGARNGPLEAYAFARGERENVAAGDPGLDAGTAQLAPGRELDFLAVTDHSEWLTASYGCGLNTDGGMFDPASPFVGSPMCGLVQSATAKDAFVPSILDQYLVCHGGETLGGVANCLSVTQSAWEREQEAAAVANDACHFTSFVAYEWTYSPGGSTLHRNVIFGSDQVVSVPLDADDYTSPNSLFRGLEASCLPDAGCDALVIPHNTNLSNGLAFELADTDAGSLALQNKYEREIEILQHKGSSECYWDVDGGGNPLDPQCQYEQHVETGQKVVPGNFVRSGLGSGLALRSLSGINPFQMGIVGGTDDHNGLPGNVGSDTWPGHTGQTDDSPAKRLLNPAANGPGGLTGIWAEQNTRGNLFAALKRRETMATSGPRIAVRLFQTWDATAYCSGALPDGGMEPFPENIIDVGAAPMGSVMAPPPGGVPVPSFTVSALKDRDDLAEVDIIKLSFAGGANHEQVFTFTALPSPAAVCLSWQDRAFDPTAPALYYARVLEVPTYRWSHYDCVADPAADPQGCGPDGGLDVRVQQRAWTSPIWWEP